MKKLKFLLSSFRLKQHEKKYYFHHLYIKRTIVDIACYVLRVVGGGGQMKLGRNSPGNIIHRLEGGGGGEGRDTSAATKIQRNFQLSPGL